MRPSPLSVSHSADMAYEEVYDEEKLSEDSNDTAHHPLLTNEGVPLQQPLLLRKRLSAAARILIAFGFLAFSIFALLLIALPSTTTP